MNKKQQPRVLLAGALPLVLAACGSLAFSDDGRPLELQTDRAAITGSAAQEELSVREAEAHWLEALENRDAAALRALLDENFVDITRKGEVRDRRAAVAALDAPARASTKQELQDVRVRFAAPDVAIVTGVNVVSSKAPDFTARVRFTDVFVKRAGVWKALSAQETLERNGQS